MSLISLSLCGVLLKAYHQPSLILESLYQSKYSCNFEESAPEANAISANELYRHFPGEPKLWPVFTADKLPSKSFDKYISEGVKPGIIIPSISAANFNFSTYLNLKSAAKKGAIVVIEAKEDKIIELYSAATFASAVGLRPQIFLINGHLDESILGYEKGVFLINNSNDSLYLPVPNGVHTINNKNIAPLDYKINYSSGLQAVLNPNFNTIILKNLDYPPLGVEWIYAGSHFSSNPDGLDTTAIGHTWIMLTLIAVPIGRIFSGELPDIFVIGASTISYVSVLFGSLLIIIFIFAMLRSRRS